jgi:type I restriction-modification system DNA methylase subunit
MDSKCKIAVPQNLIRLIERFEQNHTSYSAQGYNETQLRREFLDPFFEVLGWDVPNKQGYAEAYKEVIHEDAVKVGTAIKAPDYSFRIGGTRKYFVEAKKPFVKIKDNIEPAFQLRRYAWSAKLPLSILTNFEEFAVYDCREKPNKNDKASVGRILYMRYDEFEKRWDEIASILSKDAILKGSFDKYAESAKGKRGTSEVDDAFLEEIERWRALLAKNIASKNPDLSQKELNFAVQRTIDRIVFLRICEDRGIEHYGTMKALLDSDNVYEGMRQNFRKADEVYNSGLFHFHDEKGRAEPPDTLTLTLKIDDKPLKDIINNLYYPECPYEFSVLPADILGQVYERFLGNVIRLTTGHQAKIDVKPEVKKAGGVYYTPSYIVSYIVENTVGNLIHGKTPRQIESIRVLDPACGSGSFLIQAYQHLVDYHRDWYLRNGQKKYSSGKTPALTRVFSGEWRLSTSERKRILLNNIYGVDIDSQAVEVTKLSLLLKVLEGENEQSIAQQLSLFHERALPDLERNIKCGNSLIGSDYVVSKQQTLFGDETIEIINPFDWSAEFGQNGKILSFSAIIGNPPYIDVKLLDDITKSALIDRYISASNRFDLYIPFVEKAISLLSPKDGVLGFILPSMFLRREYGEKLRNEISKRASVLEIVDFGTNQVFDTAMNYTCLLFLSAAKQREEAKIIRFHRAGFRSTEIAKGLSQKAEGVQYYSLPVSSFSEKKEWYLSPESVAKLSDRMFTSFPKIGAYLENASEGIHSGKDDVFFVSSDFAKSEKLEKSIVHPLAKGKDVHRYLPINPDSLSHKVIYPYDLATGDVLTEGLLSRKCPNVYGHLVASRPSLKGRSYFDKSSKLWYELWCQRSPNLFTKPKILSPEICCRGEYTVSMDPLFVNNKVKAILLAEKTHENILYVLGLLNSKLLVYLHRLISAPKGNNYFEVKTAVLSSLPYRPIDFSSPSEKSVHDAIVQNVAQIFALKNKLIESRLEQEKTTFERRIIVLESSIDSLVFQLFGLDDNASTTISEYEAFAG